MSSDREAFEALYRGTRVDLLAYALRRSRTAEDAADVLSETYLIAWRKLDQIPKGQEARLWLFGVARNVLRRGAEHERSRDELVQRLARETRNAMTSECAENDHRTIRTLRAALAGLGERDREILTLSAWEGLTPRQIAAVIGMPTTVVRARLYRARSRLKARLGAAEGNQTRPTGALLEHDRQRSRREVPSSP